MKHGKHGLIKWILINDAGLLPLVNIHTTSHNYGKIHPFSMGKSTISMAMFNSYVKLPEGNK